MLALPGTVCFNQTYTLLQRMPPKEKEEVPEVWTKREFTTGEGDAKETFSMKIREPQEMSDVMTKFVCETTEAVGLGQG